MKKFLSLFLVLTLMSILFMSCSSTSASSEATISEAEASAVESGGEATSEAAGGTEGDALTVAMLMPGPINDQGWNAKAYEGLMAIEEQLGAEVTFTENVQASDYEELFRGYAELGYDMILGHGFQFVDAAMAVAPQYPDSFFVITSTSAHQEPNLCGLQNKNDEMGFLAGVVAALETETGVVGSVGGAELPPITAYQDGFEAGVAHIDPEIEVLTSSIGNNDDTAAAKQMAQAMIDEGADVLSHDANAAGLGVFEAVNEAPEGVRIIGCIDDQYDLAPDRVITSAMNAMSDAILHSAIMLQEGELEPIAYNYGVAEGTVSVADFRDYPISDENRAVVEDVVEQLRNGEIELTIQEELEG